jgi:hypothetical protein
MQQIPSTKLCPNLKVFAWDVLANSHELVMNDPEASIIDIEKFINEQEKDAYYAVYMKNHYDEEHGIVAMIPSKKLSDGSKLLGFTAMRTAKLINNTWWFR